MPSRRLTPDEAKAARYWKPPHKRLGLTTSEQREWSTLSALPLREMSQAQRNRYFQLCSYQGAAERNRRHEASVIANHEAERQARQEAQRQAERHRWAGVLEEAKRHEAAILAEWGFTV